MHGLDLTSNFDSIPTYHLSRQSHVVS